MGGKELSKEKELFHWIGVLIDEYKSYFRIHDPNFEIQGENWKFIVMECDYFGELKFRTIVITDYGGEIMIVFLLNNDLNVIELNENGIKFIEEFVKEIKRSLVIGTVESIVGVFNNTKVGEEKVKELTKIAEQIIGDNFGMVFRQIEKLLRG